MPSTGIQNLIAQAAPGYGVPVPIALAVAQQESSFNPNARGAAGEIGLFQLMPKTASMLGVDPTDITQNISGGLSFLAQLFQKYGNWSAALSAYNSGSPTGSPTYANSVLSIAGGYGTPAVPPTDSSGSGIIDTSTLDAGVAPADVLGSVDPTLLLAGGLVLVLGALWWLGD